MGLQGIHTRAAYSSTLPVRKISGESQVWGDLASAKVTAIGRTVSKPSNWKAENFPANASSVNTLTTKTQALPSIVRV